MAETNYIVSTDELMKLLRVSRQTITNWKDQGMPVYARGRWDVRRVLEWYVDRVTVEQQQATQAELDLEQERARKTKIEADQKQIELDVAQGKAIYIEDAVTRLSKVLVTVKNIVMNIPISFGKNLKEIKLTLQDEQREALNEILNFEFYEEPKTKPKPRAKKKPTTNSAWFVLCLVQLLGKYDQRLNDLIDEKRAVS